MGRRTHFLKTLAPYYDAVKAGMKTFEVRKDDRGFQKGDRVVLVRTTGHYSRDKSIIYDAENGKYVSDKLEFDIGWVLTGGQFGLEPGFVAFSLATPTEPDDG